MKPLKIALCGMDEQQASGFARTFDSLRRRLGRTWIWGGDAYETADLVVIDIDTVYGHIDWLKVTALGQRTVLYTVAEHVNESDLILRKPLKTSQLAEVLVSVAAEQGIDVTVAEPEAEPEPAAKPVPAVHPAAPAPSVPQGVTEAAAVIEPEPASATPPPAAAKPAAAVAASSKPAAAPAKPVPEMSAPVADPEPAVNSVADWMLARRAERPVSIRMHDNEWILDVERDTYHGPTTLKPLHVALTQPPGVLHPLGVEALERARKEPAQPLARLRWYAALCASPGNLAPELVADARYKLSRWPQIEREFPRHFRIATAMMKQADDIDGIASASGAPRDEVVDFINAYSAAGYIAVDGDAEDATRGVLSRIRNPFSR